MFRHPKTLLSLASLGLLLVFAVFAQDARQGSVVRRLSDIPTTTAAGFRYINPAALSAPPGYTHVVSVPAGSRTLYISGQIAFNAQGELVGQNDFAAQAEQVFANLNTALQAADATFTNVVRLDIYVTDMTQLKALRVARDKFIDLKHPPASTLVEVSKLSRDGLLLEVEATAVVPSP